MLSLISILQLFANKHKLKKEEVRIMNNNDKKVQNSEEVKKIVTCRMCG